MTPFADFCESSAAWTSSRVPESTRFLATFAGTDSWPSFWRWVSDHNGSIRVLIGRISQLVLDESWTVEGKIPTESYVYDICRLSHASFWHVIKNLVKPSKRGRRFDRYTLGYTFVDVDIDLARKVLNELLRHFRRHFEGGFLVVSSFKDRRSGSPFALRIVANRFREKSSSLEWYAVLPSMLASLGIGKPPTQGQDAGQLHDTVFQEAALRIADSALAPYQPELIYLAVNPAQMRVMALVSDSRYRIDLPPSKHGRTVAYLQPAIELGIIHRGLWRMSGQWSLYGESDDKTCQMTFGRIGSFSEWMFSKDPKTVQKVSRTLYRGFLGKRQSTSYFQESLNELCRIEVPSLRSNFKRLRKAAIMIGTGGITGNKHYSDAIAAFLERFRDVAGWPESLYDLWDALFTLAIGAKQTNFHRLVGKSCMKFLEDRPWRNWSL